MTAAIFRVGDSAAARAADVTVMRLDGSTLSGELRVWSETEILIAAPTGVVRVPADQLLSIRWAKSSDAAKPVAETAGIAELTDGTQVPFNTFTVAGGNASLEYKLPKDSNVVAISMPSSKLAAVRFQHFTGDIAVQWEDISKQNLASDALVVVKNDGKSLDYVEGTVGEVFTDKIEFKIENETNRVDRGKVAGIVYYHTATGKSAQPKATIVGVTGLRAAAAAFAVDGERINMTTLDGIALNWPIDDLETTDFSAGKLMYLSDLEPASQSWTPTVGLPSGATIASQYGQLRRNCSSFGGALSLLERDPEDATALLSAKRTFAKGLALRSRTEVVYRLPVGYSRFTALAGIDPATATTGNVQLSVLADERPLLETEIAGGQPPQLIDVQIIGAKRLKLLVDFGQNLDTGDWLNLCDAKIVK